MNADIPYMRCWVRRKFIARDSGLEEAYAFAIQSHPGRCLAFHTMLKSGAHYRNVPIHAICLDKDAPDINLGDAQLWDCFTFHPKVHVYQYLRDHEAVCYLRSKKLSGVYLFTVDWLPDHAGPGWTHLVEQNKCGHVMRLDDGNVCCLPTNRIAWRDSYFVGNSPAPEQERYKVQEEIYQAESGEWDVSQADTYYYQPPSQTS